MKVRITLFIDLEIRKNSVLLQLPLPVSELTILTRKEKFQEAIPFILEDAYEIVSMVEARLPCFQKCSFTLATEEGTEIIFREGELC